MHIKQSLNIFLQSAIPLVWGKKNQFGRNAERSEPKIWGKTNGWLTSLHDCSLEGHLRLWSHAWMNPLPNERVYLLQRSSCCWMFHDLNRKSAFWCWNSFIFFPFNHYSKDDQTFYVEIMRKYIKKRIVQTCWAVFINRSNRFQII